MSLLDEEERYRINVFDWKTEFPEAFAGNYPGFDAVIGNPPYLYSAGQDYQEYFNANFSFAQYQTDFYVYFLEKGVNLACRGGRVSFIISDSWLNSEYFSVMRTSLLTEHQIERLAVFDYPVFAGVTLENSILVIRTLEAPQCFPVDRFSTPVLCHCVNMLDPAETAKRGLIDPRYSSSAERVINKLDAQSCALQDVVLVNRGLHAYRTDGYGQSKFGAGPQTRKDKELRSYHATQLLDDTYLPEVRGKDVFRFHYVWRGEFLSYGPWLAEPRDPKYIHRPKVVLRKILGDKLHGTYIADPMAIDQSLYILVSKDDNSDTLIFCLGVLLSRLAAWYLRTKYSIYDRLYPWYTKKQLAGFPLQGRSADVIGATQLMLDLHKQLSAAKMSHDKTAIQRQIDATDRRIDKLVYELYGLADDEIRIVEEATHGG